jgi:tRNA(Ile)-lysidine synthase
MGPHPALAAVRAAVRPYLTGPVLVACSGGADSLALAAAVAFEAPRHDVRYGLITVDHGLQPGSADVAARVAAVGYELGFDPVEVVPVRVGRAGGPEGAARTARYAALAATGAALDAWVLLGHTLDDQAETVLLGLGRGSGPRSVAGMRRCAGPYRRPLLGIRRSTTVAACAALGLTPWEDPHNADPRLQRARLRHEVLPLLEDVLQGGVAEALARTADLLQDDLDALDVIAAAAISAALDPAAPAAPVPAAPDVDQQIDSVDIRPNRSVDQRGGDGVGVAELARLPRAVRTRVLRQWARGRGALELTATHLGALDALVSDWHGQGPVDLPGGVRVARASGRLEAYPQPVRPISAAEEDRSP